MSRFAYVGGCLLALAFVTAACGAEPPPPPPADSAVNRTSPTAPEPATRSIPPTVEMDSAPHVEPGAVSASPAPAPSVTPTEVPAAVVEEPDGDTATGPTPEQKALLASLPDRGQAPELENEVWLNSAPLRLAELRGKVVLLDMWTFG